MTEWQPIVTAPKDGTIILGGAFSTTIEGGREFHIFEVWYQERDPSESKCWQGKPLTNWHRWPGFEETDFAWPTHWMDRPEAPPE